MGSPVDPGLVPAAPDEQSGVIETMVQSIETAEQIAWPPDKQPIWTLPMVATLRDRIVELESALGRVDSEHRLKCAVDGEKTDDGRPAPLCPEIISDHRLMCAGCAARRLVHKPDDTDTTGSD